MNKEIEDLLTDYNVQVKESIQDFNISDLFTNIKVGKPPEEPGEPSLYPEIDLCETVETIKIDTVVQEVVIIFNLIQEY